MSYKRPAILSEEPDHSELSRDLAGIGLLLHHECNSSAMIEETLVHGVSAGMDRQDFRVMSLLVTWLDVHSDYLHADRLLRCVKEHHSARVHAFWRAFAEWKANDRRFKPLRDLYEGPRVEVLPTGTDFQVARHGEDPRFEGTILRVPNFLLRDRREDVLSQEHLSRQHMTYRTRVILGPTWRADVWSVLENDPTLSIAALARKSKAAYATAWEVHRDFNLVYAS